MYEIRPESVKSFIIDKNIRLPRFQRKQTWNEKKNFELCISLFKEYPLGVTIVNVENKNGINIRWLLDGRQRRNALVKMYEDPENIYLWAKKYIKFQNKSQPDEIKEMFWKMINEYVEYDEEEQDPDQSNESDNYSDNDNTVGIDNDSEIPSENIQSSGLDFLLDIILMIHNKKTNCTGFSKPFNLSKFVQKLPYIESNDGSQILSSKKLKTFIDQYRIEADTISPDTFYSFVDSRMNITNADNLKKYINEKWDQIKYRIYMIERLDSILTNSKIGIIEVKEILFADSQKIFNIINTKGEKLSAVEVLSAKPSWNIPINIADAPNIMKCEVADFYQALGINVDNSIVKWDLPATLIKRIGNNFILKSFDTSNTSDLSNILTYGFKLLSGIWENGIKKDDIDKLGKDKGIDWLYKYESLVKDLQTMLNVLESFSYFRFFKSWHTSIMELTNDSIALNFFIIAYKEWERKGKPSGSDSNTKPFVKNCFVLWDKLIYEYLTLKWKGSSDSKVANNIAELPSTDFVYKPVSTEDWLRLLEEIHDNYSVFGESITIKNMKPILYHFYCMKSIIGPDTDYGIEVDHIIPQEVFKNSSIDSGVQHSLYNLGLLPKKENISKSNKRLNEITDSWLKLQIKQYEFIEEAEFNTYSNAANYQQLFEAHYELFKSTFDDQGDRGKIIFN